MLSISVARRLTEVSSSLLPASLKLSRVCSAAAKRAAWAAVLASRRPPSPNTHSNSRPIAKFVRSPRSMGETTPAFKPTVGSSLPRAARRFCFAAITFAAD